MKKKKTAISMYDFSVLRDLRKNEKLSIQDVSTKSGVSVAVISKLERNQCSAELETLYKLGRVFGMNPSELLNFAESHSAHKINSSMHSSNGFRFTEINYGNIRCLYGTGKAGSKTSRPEIHKDDYEICWAISGKLVAHLPYENHELKNGEAIQFDALMEHTYEVLEDCTVLIIHIKKAKRF